ncbi:hypothetical protein A3SI_11874 [Nitritalea halalkaliphila LW7]|uniref:Uncharacterized protein n=1 Tax=Nitritalea halalkaliphila LW7 TaxID=1189621 RepID=I5C2K2_9BACT|nr:type II toxin-antitoxin system RelE/ParE family toxin [Nitritalea halalkaliphila]EIM76054.1 hypothetical protein A3SI_11874 [Nitritalea halalkaliphila LW7]
MVLEQSLGEARDRVLLLQTQEAEEQLQRLLAFVKSQNPGQEDQFTDRYRERLILYIEEDEFPAHLLDGNFQGFKDSYVTHVEDFLVFTNSSKAMRLYLDDLALGQVWENSAKGQEQWARLGQSPGLSFYFDGTSFWNGLAQRALPGWRPSCSSRVHA